MIRLIATDFDGTIHDAGSVPRIAHDLVNWLRFSQSSGAKWAICSGRQLNDELAAELHPLGGDPMPDFIVTVEREIQVRNNGWYAPDTEWNSRCAAAHADLFARADTSVRKVSRWIERRDFAELYHDKWSPLNIVADSMDAADEIHAHMEKQFRAEPDLLIVRNSIYFRLAHRSFTKGTALAEIARRLGLPKSDVFAAGDQFNDLSMLDGTHAGMVAAPSNAIPLVKDVVSRAGGYVARQPYGLGVCEALQHFQR
jgi:hypothetical protein